MKTSSSSLCIVFIFIQTINGLYEDQIGKFDWRQQYIGKVKHAIFDSTGKKIVVGTEENTLALLHAGTGKIEWRHLLGSSAKSTITSLFLLSNGKVASVSNFPTIVRVFDVSSGILQWETAVAKDIQPVLCKWSVSKRDVISIEINPSRSGYDLRLTEYSATSGTENVSPATELPWFTPGTNCQLVFPHLVCLHPQDDAVNIVDVRNSDTHQRIELQYLGITVGAGQLVTLGVTKNFVSLRTTGTFSLYKVTDEGLQRTGAEWPSETVLVSVPTVKDTEARGQYMAALIKREKNYSVRIYDLETDQVLDDVSGDMKLPDQAGEPDLLSTFLMRKPNGELSYRYAISTTDDSFHYGSKKEVYWTREEALTSIVQVEMVDLPVSSIEASIEEEFGSDQPLSGILGHTIRRLSSQFRQLLIVAQQLVAGQISLVHRDAVGSNSKALERDRFGLHKLILILTRPGKLFAMDTLSGRIVWQRLLKNVNTDKVRLYVQRTSIHYPLEPQCTILAKSSTSNQAVLFVFHPITGEPAQFGSEGYVNLSYNVQQALLLPQNEETEYMKPLLLLDESAAPHVFPPTESAINHVVKMSNNLFMFVADTKSCVLRGYSLAKSRADQLSSAAVWQLQLCSSSDSVEEEIVSIVSRHPEEKVFSQGRVLADRSVLYKYLNPNMVVVATAGTNHPHHRGYLNLYLIDVVSGAVVFSTSHRRVQSPYHVVYAENWIVYSYYNEKYRRTELSSLELFEGQTQSNSTAFSSFSAPQPLVDRQAYIYPAHITAMKDTVSEQGMTAKHILLGLTNGWIQEMPRAFLDPRRPVVAAATPEMREEGIMPYLPELPIPAEAIINYNQTISNIKSIYVTPSSLESTALVFVCGLDIFFTHVTPSRTFDVLNDDFEYGFIALVLIGLTLASFITKRLAGKKSLRQAWK